MYSQGCFRLEIEAEPWMESVLHALMGILTPTVAISVTENSSLPTESCLPTTNAEMTVEQPTSGSTVTADQDSELTGKLIQSNLVSDVGNTAENLSSHLMSQELRATVATNVSGMMVYSTSTESSTSPPKPQNIDIISESVSVNSDAVLEKEDTGNVAVLEESLTQSLPPLSTVPLTIPLCPPRYLKLSFLPDEKLVSNVLYIFIINEFDV